MEKIEIPTKTKIAAWWMIGIAGIEILSCLTPFGKFFYPIPAMICFVGIELFIPLLFLLFCGYSLLKGKKEAWTPSLIILIGILIWRWSIYIYTGFTKQAIFTFLFFIPFVLLLSSRKELFKIAPEIKEPNFIKLLAWIMIIIGASTTVTILNI